MRTRVPWPWLALLPFGLGLLLSCGCAGTSIQKRKTERPAAYAALPEPLRAMVDRGELAPGMVTNAVFIAWGKPDEVERMLDLPEGPELRWRYYRNIIHDNPSYIYASGVGRSRGIDVHTIHHTTSWKYLWREVAFRRDQAYWWRTYDSQETLPQPPARLGGSPLILTR